MNDKTKDKIKKAYFHPITGYRSSREIGKQVGVKSKLVKAYLSLLENKQIFRRPKLKYNTIHFQSRRYYCCRFIFKCIYNI